MPSASLIHNASVGLALLLLLVAAVSDVRSREIPNWVSIALAILWMAGGAGETGPALITGVVVLVAALIATLIGLWGGGDAKLLAAVAVWTGPGELFSLVALTSIFGGVLALLMIGRTCLRLRSAGGLCAALRGEMPYGVAIALAGALELIASW